MTFGPDPHTQNIRTQRVDPQGEAVGSHCQTAARVGSGRENACNRGRLRRGLRRPEAGRERNAKENPYR